MATIETRPAVLAPVQPLGVSWCRPAPPKRSGCCCIYVRTPPKRPDPAIYSQDEQLQFGQLPTWDSPDILTNHFVPWKLFAEVPVTVRNLSPLVNAVNAEVTLSISAFGIGMKRTPVSTQIISLAPGQQIVLQYPLPQSVLAGDQRIGAFVEIYHPHDSVKVNSRGAQMIAGVQTTVDGRNPTKNFPVMNDSSTVRTIALSTLPNNVGASVTPASHGFAPWEQIAATLHLHVPADLHNTTERVTVVARGPGGEVIGGLTYVVRVDD